MGERLGFMKGPSGARLPALGPRGEGWVAAQLLLYAAIAATGLRGPRWPQGVRRPLRVLSAAAGAAGVTLTVAGCVALGTSLTPNPRPRATSTLHEDGPYSLVRHPVYGGVLITAVGWSLWLSPAALAPTALTGVFLDLKSRREEAWLLERFGAYGDYRARVRRRLLPLVW